MKFTVPKVLNADTDLRIFVVYASQISLLIHVGKGFTLWIQGSFGKVFPGGSEVKNLPAIKEHWVWSLDPEDPLEKGND